LIRRTRRSCNSRVQETEFQFNRGYASVISISSVVLLPKRLVPAASPALNDERYQR
jgi:hypothetical protein